MTAKLGPQPKRDSHGDPIVSTHVQAGQVYEAADGTGWWSVSVMPPEPAASAVVRACEEGGTRPAYHERQKSRLRRDWPVLAAAIEALVDEQKGRGQ